LRFLKFGLNMLQKAILNDLLAKLNQVLEILRVKLDSLQHLF